ncbi:MAG: response regulator [Desulfobulbaceae bacterium]|jgi:DNA-binding response OmpR family regulator|nr:response regulator [Desulfobulbaceae bacterium]
MRLLIAEDEYITRIMVQVVLEDSGYHVDSVESGDRAWEILRRDHAPEIAILDWEMPGAMDGLAVCRQVKELERLNPTYIIMLTARNEPENILSGFAAGADDYMTKPFDENELRARVRVAERLVRVQRQLARSNDELRAILNHFGQGGIGLCQGCGQIQAEDGRWLDLAAIIREKDDSRFNFQICPSCQDSL